MKLFMCRTCKEGFDIECSGGIRCPECDGNVWTRINKLPSKAEPYRQAWAEKYGIMMCDDAVDIKERQLDWEAANMRSDGMEIVLQKE
jgi:hypothetical protein|tara:strand:+ start:3335 stop:3598 length:264 start_codon:yes stop_codon:yes gene_type:complete